MEVLLTYTIYAIMASRVLSARYREYVLDETQCTQKLQLGQYHRKIHLGRGAAIFIFYESSPSIYNTLKQHSITCHFELESASHNYGFHFYFEEINLDYPSSALVQNTSFMTSDFCKDYVQFVRDTKGIDDTYSDKYCGRTQRVDYSIKSSNEATRKNRMYNETQDDDVEVRLKVKSRKGRIYSFNRTLILVVTIIKENCRVSNADPQLGAWKKCRGTSYCVNTRYFCDTYSNCGWPNASDEENCDYGSNKTNMGFFRLNNIPMNIIVIILVLAFIVLIKFSCERLILV